MSNHKRRAAYQENAAGFSTVELAIVIVTVGLLIGGVIGGMKMIQNSRLVATYMKVQTTASALKTFTDKYHALPGDMSDATTRLPGCAGNCLNGNGDHLIGNTNVDIYSAQTGGNDIENTLFWYHLTAANLMNEVNTSADTAAPAWGVTHPVAAADGGLQVRSMTATAQDMADDFLRGVYITWTLTPITDASLAANAVVAPEDALFLDQKFDDGQPLSGQIRARGTDTGTGADNCRASATEYAAANGVKACYMYFRIREVPGL